MLGLHGPVAAPVICNDGGKLLEAAGYGVRSGL